MTRASATAAPPRPLHLTTHYNTPSSSEAEQGADVVARYTTTICYTSRGVTRHANDACTLPGAHNWHTAHRPLKSVSVIEFEGATVGSGGSEKDRNE
jgi:hypothetical protein